MLTPDLVYKRDVLRRRLGTELGDRAFREWLERSLAAVTPEPEEEPVAEAPSNNGQKAIAQAVQPLAAPEAAPSGEPSKKPDVNGDRPGPRIAPSAQRERLTRRWSAEEISTLYRLHGEGLPPQAIADRLGRSKRSVIGCAHRHHLEFGRCRQGVCSGDEVGKPDDAPRAVPERTPTPAHDMRTAHGPADNSAPGDVGAGAIAAEPDPDAPDSAPAPCAPCNGHDARENGHDTHFEEPEADVPEPQPAPRASCLWIEGDPGDPGWPTWCGEPQSPGRPYCPKHCMRAYVGSGGTRFPLERFHSPPPKTARRRRRVLV